MAEAIAAVGLVASIVQFVDFSAKVVRRLNELDTNTKNVPSAFKDLEVQIELLDSNLNKIRDLCNSQILDTSAQRIVEGVVQRCFHQIQRAEGILNKVQPADGDSRFRRGMKLLLSVHQENDIRDITRSISEHIQHLQLYATLSLSPTLPTRPSPSRTNSFKSVPFEKDEFFAGREFQLQKLHDLFQAGSRAALYGLGGVGKSQIAIEYGHQFLQKTPGAIVLWIYANSIARIDEAYKEIAVKAGLAGADDPSVSKYELVSNWLQEEVTDSWLMIIDNADAEEILFRPIDTVSGSQSRKSLTDFIPRGEKGRTLVTSRSRGVATTFARKARIVEVPNFTELEGRQMLEAAIGEDKVESDTEAKELLEALEYLPLAISQAAAFINENDVTVSEYLSFLKDGNGRMVNMLSDKIEDSRRDRDALNSVILSWQLSFDYLRAQKPKAAQLLSLMSMLDCKSIPKTLICSTQQDNLEFSKAMGALKSYSLVVEDRSGNNYTAHRLVHLATRAWVEKEGEAEYWHKTALEALNNVFPAGKLDDWRVCNELEPHAEAVLVNDNDDANFRTLKAKLLLRSAQDRYNQYDLDKSTQRATAALKIGQDLGGNLEGDMTAAQAYRILSWCHFGRKEFTDAISTAEKALQIYKTRLGNDATETMRARSNLSKFVMKSGNLNKAYEIQVEVLQAQRQKLGDYHDDVLYTMSRLVNTLRKLKRYDEALETLEELVAARRASGDNHHATVAAIFKHGSLLHDLGRYEDALPLLQEVCDGYRDLWGDEYSDVKEAHQLLEQCKRDIEAGRVTTTATASDNLPTRIRTHEQLPSRGPNWRNPQFMPDNVQPSHANFLLRRETF